MKNDPSIPRNLSDPAAIRRLYGATLEPPTGPSSFGRWCDSPHDRLAERLFLITDARGRVYRVRTCARCAGTIDPDLILWQTRIDPYDPGATPAPPEHIQERLAL